MVAGAHKAIPIVMLFGVALCLGCGSDDTAPMPGADVMTDDVDLADDIGADGSDTESGGEGQSCRTASDCTGNICLTEQEAGYPDGYCTAFACLQRACAGAGVCAGGSFGTSLCMQACAGETECRSGYACTQLETGQQVCAPSVERASEVTLSAGGACVSGCEPGASVRVVCGYEPTVTVISATRQWALPFEIDAGQGGYALTVWTDVGNHQINILSARNDADEVLHLKGVDSALNVSSFVDNELVTVTVPAAPQYAPFVASSTGLLQVQSTADSLCLSTAQGPIGQQIALTFYLVGGAGLTAQDIAEDADFTIMLAELRRLLALADITIGDVQARDAKPDVVEAFRVVRDLDDISALLETTTPPDDDDISVMRVNILLVDDILMHDGTDMVGRAGQLPGPPGLHGTSTSGVVADASSLRASPRYVALILVHEMGHFLGLRHTTEVTLQNFAFGRTDPLTDTPECADIRTIAEDCPDYANLMFPLAPQTRDQDSLELSDDQRWVLQRNPLVR